MTRLWRRAAEDITKKATGAVTKINAGPDPGPKEEKRGNAAPSIKHIEVEARETPQPPEDHKYPASTNTLIK